MCLLVLCGRVVLVKSRYDHVLDCSHCMQCHDGGNILAPWYQSSCEDQLVFCLSIVVLPTRSALPSLCYVSVRVWSVGMIEH